MGRIVFGGGLGARDAEVCRKHGISPRSFYKLKARYGGMDVSDAHRLTQLEEKTAKLKRLVAHRMLDVVVLTCFQENR